MSSYIAVDKRNYKPFDRSVIITNRIVELIKNRLPSTTKKLAFSADFYQPQMDEFRKIFEANGFTFSEKPVRLVEKAALEQKLVVKFDDCHWNEKGHEMIAWGLLPDLQAMIE